MKKIQVDAGVREILLSFNGIFSGLSTSTQQFDGNACQEISKFCVLIKFLEDSCLRIIMIFHGKLSQKSISIQNRQKFKKKIPKP
jgi:hypothetical protein